VFTSNDCWQASWAILVGEVKRWERFFIFVLLVVVERDHHAALADDHLHVQHVRSALVELASRAAPRRRRQAGSRSPRSESLKLRRSTRTRGRCAVGRRDGARHLGEREELEVYRGRRRAHP